LYTDYQIIKSYNEFSGDMLASDFAYCGRCYRSVVCLFVSLSCSCIVLKRMNISTRFLLLMTATPRPC